MRILFSICFLLLSVTGISQRYVSKSFTDSLEALEKSHIGQKFSNFSVKDINGKKISVSDLNGKITLINFWFEA